MLMLKRLLLILCCPLLCTSCMYYLFNTSNIQEKTNFSNQKTHKTYTHNYARLDGLLWARNTDGFYSLRQVISKEQGNNDVVVYDHLRLAINSSELQMPIIWKIDSKIFTIEDATIEQRITREFVEENEDIMKADSTKVNVITGIDNYEVRNYNINYTLPREALKALQSCKTVHIQYQAGPQLIQVTPRFFTSNKLHAFLKE